MRFDGVTIIKSNLNTPNALSVNSISIDGLEADFFHGISDKPQRALILLGGSEGGKSWSDHTAHVQQFIELGYVVSSVFKNFISGNGQVKSKETI